MTESTVNRSTPTPGADPATQAPISTKPLVSQRTRRTTAIVGAIAVVAVLAAVIAIGYFMFTAYDRVPENVVPGTVRLRDMAFVLLALETLVLMVLVLVVILLLAVVIVLIYDRVIPILEQLNKTANTTAETVHVVRGTTTFVSEKVVSPFITASSYAAGVARICKGIIDLWPKHSNGQEKPASDK
jgi:hypothetical protein